MTSVNRWAEHWAKKNHLAVQFDAETSSTNEVAKQEGLKQGQPEFKLYLADHQTHGKGRNGRSWQDSAQGTLLSTWSFHLTEPPQPILVPLVGLALFESVSEHWPHPSLALKPPNDLFIADKKVAGLLIEVMSQGSDIQVIVGLGLNILSHPQVDLSGSLIEQLNLPLLSEQEVLLWLDRFYLKLQHALQDGVLETLTSEQCQRLLHALNRKMDLTTPYSQVLKDGSLRQGNQYISWHNL